MEKLLALLSFLVLSVSVWSQTDTIVGRVHELEGVTVTETYRQRVANSPSPFRLLNRQDMLTMGVTDIADALHRLPGITLRDYGGAGGMKTVSIRGFGSKHTGVCYDGIMLSECQSGEIDLSRYSPDYVDHLSLTVGDNEDIFIPARQATTPAVLNIQTLRMPTEDLKPHLVAQMKIGSFGFASPFVRYAQNVNNRFALSVLGEYTYAENDYPYTIQNATQSVSDHRTNNRMNAGRAEVNGVYSIDGMSYLAAKLYYYDNDRQLPGEVHYYTTLSRETLRDRNFFAQLSYQRRWQDRWSLRVHGKWNWASSEYRNGLYPGGVNDASYWQREGYVTAALLYTPDSRWAFDYSSDYAFNNLNGSSQRTLVGRPYRNTLLQTATAKFRSKRFTILTRLLFSLYLNGAKSGSSANNMHRLSPSLSLSYKLMQETDLYLRASYKNIFRSPTFNELYYYHYGSSDLQPESTHQWNVGVTYASPSQRHSTFGLTLDAYYNKVYDMIVAIPKDMFVWTCVNVGKVRVLGLEASLRASRHFSAKHRLTATANYSYQQAEDVTDEQSPYYKHQIAYMPKHTLSASIGYENPWVNISLHGIGMSSRWANNEHYTGTLIDGFADCGLTLWRRFRWANHHLEGRFDLKNLFNRQYEIVYHYPMPGRNFQVSINYKF